TRFSRDWSSDVCSSDLLSSLHGAFLCSRHALPALRQSPDGGAIVNIASTRAHQSEPHSEAYAAAKGGLVAFTHALALSEGPKVQIGRATCREGVAFHTA